MDKVGIGILSHAHGHIGTYCRVMQDFADVELVTAWDDNPERGAKAAAAYGHALARTPEDVVADPRVDAVMIGIETNRHADMVELAASAGKAILLQKPMATTLADCDRIIRAVNESGVKFGMAFQMRQDPVNRKIKELLDQSAIGKIAVIRRRHSIPVLLSPSFVNGPTRWHFDPTANVGMFFDDANHPADWFYWLLGEPVSVMAEIDNIVTDVSPDDNGIAIYRFRDGIMGTLFNSSTTLAGINTTEIYGDEGVIIQDYGDSPSVSAPRAKDAKPLRMLRKGESAWTEFDLAIPVSQGERIAGVPRPFIDYVRGLSEEHVSAEEGRISVEMVLGAYLSARRGRRILFPLTD